jgi:hypothetical protein
MGMLVGTMRCGVLICYGTIHVDGAEELLRPVARCEWMYVWMRCVRH